MGGACNRCIIDNTSVIVACGSGPDAEIAPDMKVFGNMFGMDFVPHYIKDPDRKAKVERNFSFVEGNFLAGRTFSDWHDFNRQARKWCEDVANHKPKRSLGMSPDEAFLMEKAYLTPLPVYVLLYIRLLPGLLMWKAMCPGRQQVLGAGKAYRQGSGGSKALGSCGGLLWA